MVNDAILRNHTVKMHHEDGNMDYFLGVIDGLNIVPEGVHAIIVDLHQCLFVIVEIFKDTAGSTTEPWTTLRSPSLCGYTE